MINPLRNERGYTLVEVLATLAIAAVIFSVITLAMHTLRSEADATNRDTDSDRHIAKSTAVLDRLFSNATEVIAISESQINISVYEKDASGTTVIVHKALYFENGSLFVCPVSSMTEALSALCTSPATITDRLSGRPVFSSTIFDSSGTRSSLTLSASGAAGTVDTFNNGQLVNISLPFAFPAEVDMNVTNKTVSVQYKLWKH